MSIARYSATGRALASKIVQRPSWPRVEAAIRQMDNFCHPVVQLNLTERDDDENICNIVGGSGRWALFQLAGEWQYETPGGSTDEVRLWESDQGYFCTERNVLTDVKHVLEITKRFFDHGSYDRLDGT